VADIYDTAHGFRIDFARMKPDEFTAKVDEYLKVASGIIHWVVFRFKHEGLA